MTLNNTTITFDMDNQKDFERFHTAYETLTKATSGNAEQFGLNDMRKFLTGCLSKKDSETLLADGRISTLVKVFVEFFSEGVKQIAAVSDAYKQATDIVVVSRKEHEKVDAKFDQMHRRLQVVGGPVKNETPISDPVVDAEFPIPSDGGVQDDSAGPANNNNGLQSVGG